MPNPYSPTVAEGEPASLVWFERSLFNGQHLESVMYGKSQKSLCIDYVAQDYS